MKLVSKTETTGGPSLLESFSDFYDQCFSDECFSRSATREWNKTVVLGMSLGGAEGGLSREADLLGFGDNAYKSMNHNLHSSGLRLDAMRRDWSNFVFDLAGGRDLFYKVGGHVILAIDETSKPRDGKAMPAVERGVQKSNDSGKRERTTMQKFCSVGVVLRNGGSPKCVMLGIEDNPTLGAVSEIKGKEKMTEAEFGMYSACSLADALVREGRLEAGAGFGAPEGAPAAERRHKGPLGGSAKAIVVCDRAGYNVKALEMRDKCAESGMRVPEYLCRCMGDARAFEIPAQGGGGKGRPRIYGDPVKLMDVFETRKDKFEEVTLTKANGKTQTRGVYSEKFVWKQGYGRILNFCFSVDPETGAKSVFMTTDLTLGAAEIVEIYTRRFDLEHAFKGLKQVTHAFDPYFWSKGAPRLGKNCPNAERDRILRDMDDSAREGYLASLEATEAGAFAGCVATGFLQLSSLLCGGRVDARAVGYRRTYSRGGEPSLGELSALFRREVLSELGSGDGSGLAGFILESRVERPGAGDLAAVVRDLIV